MLKVAGDMLFENGLAAITFDRVAARAGSSKMTLYKWWQSPGALAYEAYSAAVAVTLAFEDTGDVAADLKAQLRAFVGLLTGNRVIAELIGAAQSDPILAAEFTRSYTLPRRARAVDRLTSAQLTGQIRDSVDLEIIVDQLWGACYHRLLLGGPSLDAEFTDALVDNVLLGVTPHPR